MMKTTIGREFKPKVACIVLLIMIIQISQNEPTIITAAVFTSISLCPSNNPIDSLSHPSKTALLPISMHPLSFPILL